MPENIVLMPKRSGEEEVSPVLLAEQRQNNQPIFMNRGGNQEETTTGRKKDCFRYNSLVVKRKSSDDYFLQYQYNISPYLQRGYLSYEANKCPKPQSCAQSLFGKSDKHNRSRIFLIGRILLLFILPARKSSLHTTTKSPAIEVSGSDIEPNCVRWAVPIFP